MNACKCWTMLIAILLLPNVAASADPAKEAAEKGKACLDNQDYDGAITALTEAIRLDPKNALAYCDRGFAHCKRGHREKASREYNAATPLNDKEMEDQWWSARKCYERMPILGPIMPGAPATCLVPPSDDQVMRALEKVWAANGRLPREIKRKNTRIVVELLIENTDPPRVYPLVGRAICHNVDYKCTVSYAEVSASGSPDTKADEEAREVIYIDQDHLHLVENVAVDKAIADFSEAIRLNPRLADAYGGRGVVHYLQGDYERALANFTETIRLIPKSAEPHYDRGMVYLMKNDHDKAIADYTEAIRLNPKHAEAFHARGHTYERYKNDDRRAEADFAQAKKLRYKEKN